MRKYKEAVQIKKSGTVYTAYLFADKAVKISNFKNIVKVPDTLISTERIDMSSFPLSVCWRPITII